MVAGAIGASGANARAAAAAVSPYSSGNVTRPCPRTVAYSALANANATRYAARSRVRRRSPASGRSSVRATTMPATKVPPTSGCPSSIRVSAAWATNYSCFSISVSLSLGLCLVDNPCRLFCTDVDDTIIANWGETVLDGTPCTLGTNNMCIDGICKVSLIVDQ